MTYLCWLNILEEGVDSENLKALGEKLPSWLYREVNQVEDEYPEESTLLAVGVGAR